MTEDNFLPGGFFFVYRDILGGHCCVHSETSEPDPRNWLAWDGGEYHRTERPGEPGEKPDGRGGWVPDLEALRAGRLVAAKRHRDECLARDPADWPDTDDHEQMGRHLIHHSGRIHIAHRVIVRRITAAATADELAAIDITEGYPPTI